ncbi:MAG: hypothetical protein MUO60_11355 [Clostridiaceae bacterium]|nr:hypothetical protein [Clostridiaceae bacterium]
MNNKKLGKAKNSINRLDANKSNSGVLNTEMAIMYNLSNKTSDINDTAVEEKANKFNDLKKKLNPVTNTVTGFLSNPCLSLFVLNYKGQKKAQIYSQDNTS